MIPREILKKIRQIEIRANRVVTELVFWSTLTCVLSPKRGLQPVTRSVYLPVRSTNPVAGFSKDAVRVSPSPWGEGRDEGGQEANFALS